MNEYEQRLAKRIKQWQWAYTVGKSNITGMSFHPSEIVIYQWIDLKLGGFATLPTESARQSLAFMVYGEVSMILKKLEEAMEKASRMLLDENAQRTADPIRDSYATRIAWQAFNQCREDLEGLLYHSDLNDFLVTCITVLGDMHSSQ